MLSVLIVDDDIEVLNGMPRFIDWQGIGFEVVGSFSSAPEALSFMERAHVDVLITDIQMPLVGGLELIERARVRFPDLQSVILTCYSDFAYAREAVRLRAARFVLKDEITREGLTSLLTDLRKEIEGKQVRDLQVRQMETELLLNHTLLRDSLLSDLCDGRIATRGDLLARARVLNVDIPLGRHVVLCMAADEEKRARQFLSEKLVPGSAAPESIDPLRGIARELFVYNDRSYVLVYPRDDQQAPVPRGLREAAAQIAEILTSQAAPLSVCVGDEAEDVLSLGRTLASADRRKDALFYLPLGSVIGEDAAFADIGDTGIKPTEAVERHHTLLLLRRKKEALALAESVAERVRRFRVDPGQVRSLLSMIAANLSSVALEHGVSIDSSIGESSTLDRCLAVLRSGTRKYFDACCPQTGVRSEIRRVIEYLEENVATKVGLLAAAQMAHLSPGHFSRLFKEQTGVSFSDYVLKKRVGVAEDLLAHSTLSVDEIVDSIGLSNKSYFYRAFKKIVGRNPGDLRKR